MALKIGSLSVASGVVQSPMAQCTDLAFRMVGRERGMEFAFLEMLSAHALLRNNAKTLRLMRSIPGDRPLGAQLVGCDPGVMAEAAAAVEEEGFELLDLNLGCPVPKVVAGGEGGGSALLAKPDKAEAIFRSVARALKRIPLTVKMRIGYQDPTGAEAVDIARRAQDSGVAAVCVHGRTRVQRYTGKADYAAIGRVKAAVSIPVIGNGDVYTGEDARRLVRESGCDGVMIGRGALGNPWIYRDAAAALAGAEAPAPPTLEEKRSALLRHLELELEHSEERMVVLQMRRVACWYFAGYPGSAAFREAVCRSENAALTRSLIEGFGKGEGG